MLANDASASKSRPELPLAIQAYLFEQSSKLVKARPVNGKYEATCMALERVLCDNRIKELRLSSGSLASAIHSTPRWTLLQGALPHVMQGLSQILANRVQLGLSDKLSVPVTKLLYTLHWILLRGATECGIQKSEVEWPLETLELFIQSIVPCADSLQEEDLTFSLEDGMRIWEPLWHFLPPAIPSFCQKVPLPSSSNVLLALDAALQGRDSMVQEKEIDCWKYRATVFDVAVLRCLATGEMSEDTLSWVLGYLLRYLLDLMDIKGIQLQDIQQSKIRNYAATAKKQASYQRSVSLLGRLDSERHPSENLGGDDESEFEVSVSGSLSDMHKWISVTGHLDYVCILKAVIRVLDMGVTRISGENITLILLCLIELGVYQAPTLSVDAGTFNLVLTAVVKTVRMIGCEFGCGHGVRGQRGESLRHFVHSYIKRLISLEPTLCQQWIENYARSSDLSSFFSFLHAFCGYCEGNNGRESPATPKIGETNLKDQACRGSVTDIAVTIQLSAILFREMKFQNGENILKWASSLIFEKLISSHSVSQHILEEASRYARYLRIHHEKVFRSLIMGGFAMAFSSASKERKKSVSKNSSGSSTPARSPLMPHVSPRAKRQLYSKMHGKGSINEGEPSKMPFKPMLGMLKKFPQDTLSENEGYDLDETIGKSGKDQSTWKQLFRKKANTRQKIDTAMYDDQDEADVFMKAMSNLNQKRVVNFKGLHQGMLKLRVLFEMSPPGVAPEAAVIAATLNLQAPVVARAAFLMECANFVSACRKGEWPTYFKLSSNVRSKEFSYRLVPALVQVQQMKQEAAEMFYNWGVVLGEKLETILISEQLDLQKPAALSRRYYNDDSSFILQGSKNAVSSRCPNSLKYAACLLLLEITAFLRETYPLLKGYSRERSLTTVSQGNGTPTLGNKVHTLLQIPGKKGKAKLQGHKSATLNSLSSTSQEDQSEKSAKIKRKPSLFSVHQASVGTSPLANRKQSRGISRPDARMLGVASFGQASIDSSHDDEDVEDARDLAWNFAWIGGVVSFLRSVSFLCTHENRCVDSCVLSHSKCVTKLLDALTKTYVEDTMTTAPPNASDGLPEAETLDETKEDAIVKYVHTQGNGLLHVPFSLLCKAALILDGKVLIDILPAAWELLDHVNNQLVSSAACIFLFSGLVLDNYITDFISKEFNCSDPADQMKALKKFDVLWNTRHHVWKRLEENAIQIIKVPPMKVDYTLPSPLLGGDTCYVPDCPWVPGSPFPIETEEVEQADRYLYHLDREKHKVIKAEKRARSLEQQRSAFPLNTIPFSRDADAELHTSEEDESGGKASFHELDFFPPSIAFVVPDLINLFDNNSLDSSGNQVGAVALEIAWRCMVNDPTMFFRFFFEKITTPELQRSLIVILKKLLHHIPQLPSYTATILFNHLVGIIMYYTRHTNAETSERIAALVGLLWQVSPSVPNLVLKDMKQSLKKEYCEGVFLATANTPGAKVLVASPCVKLDVYEDTTFSELMSQFCRVTSRLKEPSQFFVDKLSGHILEPSVVVRDVYAHKRGYPPPVIRFERLDEHISYKRRQLQVFLKKLSDIGRMLLLNEIFTSHPVKKHLSFLLSEFLKQNSFPRKAIEFEFELANEGTLGKEIFALDVTLKDIWVKFVCSLLEKMPALTSWTNELQFFLDVINGALLLHCEDVVILRTCMVSYLNLCLHFAKYFSVNGYQRILPALFRVYGQYQDNNFVKDAIEFTVRQFYILHQIPFLLQLFACVSPMIDIEAVGTTPDENGLEQVPGKCLYLLLRAIEQDKDDNLDILVSLHCEKPLKPFDLFYAGRPDNEINLIDISLRLTVTVIAYDPESLRANQMLVVLCTVLPNYLQESSTVADKETNVSQATKFEVRHLKRALTYMQTVLLHSEHLCSSFQFEDVAGSTESLDSTKSVPVAIIRSWWSRAWSSATSAFRKTNKRNVGEKFESLSMVGDEENPFYARALSLSERESLDNYYIPRMMLLYAASDFVSHCITRMDIIKRRMPDRYSFPEIYDEDHLSILVTIASSLLRLAFDDQDVLTNSGLRRFFLMALPVIDWSDEKQYALLDLVQRVSKVFSKILSRPDFIKYANWDALEVFVRGISMAVTKSKALASNVEIRSLLSVCIQLTIGDFPSHWEDQRPSAQGVPNVTVSYAFQNTVVKFAAKLLEADSAHYNLRNLCSGYPDDTNVTRLTSFLLHWLLPLCMRLGTNRYDQPRLPDHGVTYALDIILSCLTSRRASKSKPKYESFVMIGVETAIAPVSGTSFKAVKSGQRLLGLHRIAFLGLKILIAAYTHSLGTSWNKISRKVATFIQINPGSEPLWDFMHFIVFHRFPLYLHLQPFMLDLMQKAEDIKQASAPSLPGTQGAGPLRRVRIERDLSHPPVAACTSGILQCLLQDLTALSHPGKDVLMPNTEQKEPVRLGPVPQRPRKSSVVQENEIINMKLDRLTEQSEDQEEDEERAQNESEDGGVFEARPSNAPAQRRFSEVRAQVMERNAASESEQPRIRKRVSFSDDVAPDPERILKGLPPRQQSIDRNTRLLLKQSEVETTPTNSSATSDADMSPTSPTDSQASEKSNIFWRQRRNVIRSRKHNKQQLGPRGQQAATFFRKKLATFSESISDEDYEERPRRQAQLDRRKVLSYHDEGFAASIEDNDIMPAADDENYSSAAELLQNKTKGSARANGHSAMPMQDMFYRPPDSNS